MGERSGHGYDPRDVEPRWYALWERQGFFHAELGSSRPPYTIVIPPPNITGSLHMGHALNNTLQDVLIRWRRMAGDNALWVPGTDHAGIATQNVVERQLLAEGLTRQQIGREAFVARVWQWREQSGGTIINQLKKLGASCDWVREAFTMDGPRQKAVLEAFTRLWADGLLYRAERLVNWCPRCGTALADIEVVHEEIDGTLWHIRYPFAGDPKSAVVVATTRPETMLADTGVAVHPEDPRYAKAVGRHVILPLVGRKLPVIADPYVSREFGTGALKITPGHDFNDFEIGQQHGLPTIATFFPDGTLREDFLRDASKEGRQQLQSLIGLDRSEVRRKVLDDLRREGFLVKEEPYRYALGRCYRCQTDVEPYLTPQWFVRTKPLAEPAIRVVEEGRVRIIPPQWEKNYFEWMQNIRDWCISRQIWWGHQIPAWYCRSCDAGNIIPAADGGYTIGRDARPIVARERPTACPRCGSQDLVQDPDVLDTWFSSALWPFSTVGWPEQSKELEVFYPTTVLVTAFDILFFWVARMIMMGLKCMGDVPFRQVYIHALVRDPEGQKMSKSKGNVIDPLVVIEQYGADALRCTLTALIAQGRDVRLSEERIEGYRHFCNKIWNAFRFVGLHLSPDDAEALRRDGPPPPADLVDRWIVSRLQEVIASVTQALETFRFSDAVSHLYQFLWHEYCDWYLEFVKVRLTTDGDQAAARTGRLLLAHVLEVSLRLLHPIMPFITEEIWQHLPHPPGAPSSVMIAPWPLAEPSCVDPEAVRKMDRVMAVIRAIRNIRSEVRIPLNASPTVLVKIGQEEDASLLASAETYVRQLARVREVRVGRTLERPRRSAVAVTAGMEIYIPLEGLIDIAAEAQRVDRELQKVAQELERVNRKLSNRDFLARAPAEVVAKERETQRELGEASEKLTRHLSMLRDER
ncbi:MAG TPA: valine--tRNA ligase [Candidatus Methylomirabilis sp.]|nr:valine--tRNA ligase [Candidatus Methylomirabilis sp.]